MTSWKRATMDKSGDKRRTHGRGWQLLASLLILAVSGCTHNPLLGKWNIGKREKEAEASYVDELTSDVRTASGATGIEFRKGSIVITGGAQDRVESGIEYSVQELESGATDVRILQPRKGDTSKDIDVCHIDPSGKTATIESRTEILNITRADQ